MKKILSVFLAALMMLTVMSVMVFAAPPEVYLKSSGTTLEPGDTWDPGIYIVDGGKERRVSKDSFPGGSVSIEVIEGKEHLSSLTVKSDDGEKYLYAKARSIPKSDNDEDVVFKLVSKDSSGKTTSTATYTIVVQGKDSVSSSKINESSYTIAMDELEILNFDEDLARCTVDVSGDIYMYMRFGKTSTYRFKCVTDEVKALAIKIEDEYPSADLQWYRFTTATAFNSETEVRIRKDGYTHLYEVSGSKLQKLDYTESGSYFVFKTKKMGSYLLSDTALNYVLSSNPATSGSTSSSSGTGTSKPSTSKPSTSTSKPSNSTTVSGVSASSIEKAAAASSSGATIHTTVGTANKLTVKELQAISNKYTDRKFVFRHVADKKVQYQFSLSNAEIKKMTGTDFYLGMDDAASTKATFTKWYSNQMQFVRTINGKNGASGYFAVLPAFTSNNLYVYRYDASTNRYDRVASSSITVSGGYVMFPGEIGYSYILCDGPLKSK